MPSREIAPVRRVRRRLSTRITGLALIALAGGVLAACSSSPAAKNSSSSTSVVPKLASDVCPLTDVKAPNGVPDRPALGVKIGNEPDGARPQSGLNEADIVFDTPAEGFIMRYIAVYQCQNASSIGPTRSVRFVDWHIMRQFIHPILAFAGGINPDVDAVESLKWLMPADLLTSGSSAGTRISSRVAPDNLYTSTAALYGLFPKATGAPSPVFSYTPSLPAAAKSASSLQINFSAGTDVIWKWDSSTNSWLHTYLGTQDIDTLTNQPVSTTNIIVQIVHYNIGPYIESPGGSGDIESQTVGSGNGWVLRNGKAIAVTWHRRNLISGTTFTDSSGQQVGLAPGRTWVEMVPDTVANEKGAIVINS